MVVQADVGTQQRAMMGRLSNADLAYIAMLLSLLLEHFALLTELVGAIGWLHSDDSGVDERRNNITNVQDQ